jgi:hypothetical protein
VTSFVRDADDSDDDYLPDSWELQFGLSTSDNGFTDPNQGEYGDPDADSLNNRDEWLLGTNPMLADTDEDGYSDGQEVFFLGTNPLVAELANPSVVGEVELEAYANASASWVPTPDGGVLAMDTRGWIDYPITITENGFYLFEIRGRARGANIRPREDFLLDVLINSKKVATATLTSRAGNQGLAGGFAGWLTAGTHTVRIWNHNLLGRRALQLDSLKILKPSVIDQDQDQDGLADWVEQFLIQQNNTVWNSPSSFISPVCIEGQTRNIETASITLPSGTQQPLTRGIEKGWFIDVPLNPSGDATPLTLNFENGLLPQNLPISWLPFNISAMSQLIVRRGDSLRLTGHPPGEMPGSGNVSYALNGVSIGNQAANSPMTYTFATPGTHTLRATYATPQGNVVSNSIIEVLAADFGPVFPLYMGRIRLWSLPNVAPSLFLEKDNALSMSWTSSTTGSRYAVDTKKMGNNTILARAADSAPVLARGQVDGILLSHSGNEETVVIQTLPNGDRVVEFTLMATQLPPGGYIRLEIWLGGRLFLDGSLVQTFYASDFDQNGIRKVRMILSSGIGTTCHRTFLHDASGTVIGEL